MAKIRYLPFGYRIKQGEIILHPEEAAYVQEMFTAYITGNSYAQIAQKMQDQGIQYHKGTADWNKHMVKRILENRKYLGEDGYPAIIAEPQYQLAAAVRQRKATSQPSSKPRQIAMPILPAEIKTGVIDLTVIRLENQIRQELTRPVLEPERLLSMICQCAVQKYDAHFAESKPIPATKMDAGSVHLRCLRERRI